MAKKVSDEQFGLVFADEEDGGLVFEEDTGLVFDTDSNPLADICEGDCPMCLGKTCRWCGFGCWDVDQVNCQHDLLDRHRWEPSEYARRRERIIAEVRRHGAEHVLETVLAPDEYTTIDRVECFKCHKPVERGSSCLYSLEGTSHLRCK